MTIEQREEHILSLVHKLPILRRIQLALTILRDVEPEIIPVEEETEGGSSENLTSTEDLAKKVLSRKKSFLKSEGTNISRQELLSGRK